MAPAKTLLVIMKLEDFKHWCDNHHRRKATYAVDTWDERLYLCRDCAVNHCVKALR